MSAPLLRWFARSRDSPGWVVSMVAVILGLVACTPAWDWRALRWEPLPLSWSVPCRPESVVRAQQLAGQALEMEQRVCVHRGHTWALTCAALPDPAQATEVLRHWRVAVLSGIQVLQPVRQEDFRPAAALALPESGKWAVEGDWQGQAVALTGAWFVVPHAAQLHACHALHLAQHPAPQQAAPFWQALLSVEASGL